MEKMQERETGIDLQDAKGQLQDVPLSQVISIHQSCLPLVALTSPVFLFGLSGRLTRPADNGWLGRFCAGLTPALL